MTLFTKAQQEALLVMRAAISGGGISEWPGQQPMDSDEINRVLNGLATLKARGFTQDEVARMDATRLAVRAGFYTDQCA